MAQVINTNALSLMAQNNLNKSQTSLGTAIQRLSSGMRINSAKDDAAGLAISNRFTSSIRGMTQAARNANDGISLAQTTEGALEEVTENMQRIRELTVQAKSGTNSPSDLDSIKKEIGTRLEEIGRVAEVTNFNGVKVFDGTKDKITIQIGDKDADTIDIKLNQLDMKTLGLDEFLDDFSAIGFNVVKSQFNAAGTTAEAGVTSFTADKLGIADPAANDYVFDTTDETAFFNVATKVTGNVGDKEVVTVEEDGLTRFFVVNAVTKQAQEVTATFDHDAGASEDVTLDTVTAGEVLGAIDTDMLINGAPTLTDTDTKRIKKDDTVNIGGVDVVLDAAKMDAISTAAFGQNVADSGMRIFSVAGAAADTFYAMNSAGEVKEFALDTTGAVTGTVTDAGAGNAQIVKQGASRLAGDNLLERLDDSLTQIADFRADLGAVQNRFSSIVANLNTNIINTTEARSRIQDADFSVEVSAMSRANILQQAGVSVLGQANQVPQNVLSLLR
jgi:flagellin